MVQPQQPPVADPSYPGWAWDAASGRWVPATPQAGNGQQGAPYAPGPAHPGPHQGGQYQQGQWQAGQWQGQPGYVPPVLPGPTIGQHLKRALDWNVTDIRATPRERAQLDAKGVVEPRMQATLAWRRSALLIALPIFALDVILSIVDKVSAGEPKVGELTIHYTPLGQLARWLPTIALALVPLAIVLTARHWTELHKSSRTLIVCWGLSIVLPVVVALLPVEALLDFEPLRQMASQADMANGTVDGSTAVHGIIVGERVSFALQYALVLLPVIITVPSGVIKGAGRMRFLYPAATLPAWFLLSVAPFYSLFLVVVFVVMVQIYGNVLLVLGVGLLAFGPWVFVLRRKIYGRAMSTAEAQVVLPKAGRLGGYITLGAYTLVALWAITASVEGTDILGSGKDADAGAAAFSYVQGGRFVLDLFARNLFTSVVFAMMFVFLVFADWRATKQLPPEVVAEHDREMTALRRYVER